ncbi:MAG: hypothetical protein U0V73_13430 [Acidimicrobiia bacterium]
MIRRARPAAILTGVVLLVCALGTPYAHGDGGGGPRDGETAAGCTGSDAALSCGVVVHTPGEGGEGGASGGPGVARPYYWTYEVTVFRPGGPLPGGVVSGVFEQAGGIPAPSGPNPPGLTPGAIACGARQGGSIVDGQATTAREVQRSTGSVVASRIVCVALRGGAVPPLDAAPTYAEIWRNVALPRPVVLVSPKVTGLTGMPTWFWYDQTNLVQVDVTLNGWTVTGAAHLTQVEWDTGDHHVASVGGTFDAPVPLSSERDHAAEHVYETKGTYPLGASTEWEGRVHVTGPNGEASDEDLGTFRLAPAIRVYDVLEARASLIPEPAG